MEVENTKVEDIKLKLGLDDVLSRPDFEWQEYVVENPVETAEAIVLLLEYVRVMEGLE